MKHFFGILLSPLAFAVGFLWPLVTQVAVAQGWVDTTTAALLLGAIVAIPLGALAQFRGSWVWIKS